MNINGADRENDKRITIIVCFGNIQPPPSITDNPPEGFKKRYIFPSKIEFIFLDNLLILTKNNKNPFKNILIKTINELKKNGESKT